MGAIKGASIPLPHPLYWHPTLNTSFIFFLKNSQETLVFSSVPTRIHKIRKTGSAMSDGDPQHCLDRFSQSRDFRGVQCKAPARRMNSGKEKRLTHIDISKSGNLALIEKEGLNFLPACLHQR
jgi:hypothetical protein